MVYGFIQVHKQFHTNALNDHNFSYMTKEWSQVTSSVIPSPPEVAQIPQGSKRSKVLWLPGQVLTQRATSASWDRGTRKIILVDDDILRGYKATKPHPSIKS